MVDDSQGLDHTGSPTTEVNSVHIVNIPQGLNSNAATEHMTLQDSLIEVPVVVQQDLKILSKFWSNAIEEEEDEEGSSPEVNEHEPDNNFELVLSKSQKKKLNQQRKQKGKPDRRSTRSRAGSKHYA